MTTTTRDMIEKSSDDVYALLDRALGKGMQVSTYNHIMRVYNVLMDISADIAKGNFFAEDALDAVRAEFDNPVWYNTEGGAAFDAAHSHLGTVFDHLNYLDAYGVEV